jgi:hypothetical protein
VGGRSRKTPRWAAEGTGPHAAALCKDTFYLGSVGSVMYSVRSHLGREVLLHKHEQFLQRPRQVRGADLGQLPDQLKRP